MTGGQGTTLEKIIFFDLPLPITHCGRLCGETPCSSRCLSHCKGLDVDPQKMVQFALERAKRSEEGAIARLSSLMSLADLTKGCIVRRLLQYFGEQLGREVRAPAPASFPFLKGLGPVQ